jgi:transposase-like protein
MELYYVVGERNQSMAKEIVAKTAKRLASIPLFVTDGLKFYTKALLEQYGNRIKQPLPASAEDLEKMN